MKNNDFAIFILTHGRANNVITFKALKKTNLEDDIYFIVDDKDEQLLLYQANFGIDRVLVFNKDEIGKTFDLMDNTGEQKAVVFARNAAFKLAGKIGKKYFLCLDDDYSGFYFINKEGNKLKHIKIIKLQEVINAILKFYKNTPFKSIAMAQGGDYLGGINSGFLESRKRKRKCMNSFFCSTDRPFTFIGRMNEDVNAYVNAARTGGIFYTIPHIMLVQKQTQQNKGGLTDIYLKFGTFVKSFYTVMISPSSVRVAMMGKTDRRLHHKLKIDNTFQEIIPENIKKYGR